VSDQEKKRAMEVNKVSFPKRSLFSFNERIKRGKKVDSIPVVDVFLSPLEKKEAHSQRPI